MIDISSGINALAILLVLSFSMNTTLNSNTTLAHKCPHS